MDADGSTVWLDRADGSPVASTLPADDGSYAFPPVVAGVYPVRVEPAPGVAVTGTNPHVVDVTGGDFDDADYTLSCPRRNRKAITDPALAGDFAVPLHGSARHEHISGTEVHSGLTGPRVTFP